MSGVVSLSDKSPLDVHGRNIHYLLGDSDVRALFITVLSFATFPQMSHINVIKH